MHAAQDKRSEHEPNKRLNSTLRNAERFQNIFCNVLTYAVSLNSRSMDLPKRSCPSKTVTGCCVSYNKCCMISYIFATSASSHSPNLKADTFITGNDFRAV